MKPAICAIVMAVLASAIVATNGANARAQSAQSVATIRTTVERVLSAHPEVDAPGVAIVVLDAATPAFVYRGNQQLGGPPVGGQTIFELGSLTKSFTAIMLAQAIVDGTGGVTLGDSPAKWVAIAGNPDATAPHPVGITCPTVTATPLPRSAFGSVTRMTLEMLATHTAGLPRVPPGPAGTPRGRQCYAPQELVNFIEAGSWQVPAPYDYSNIGFGFLGYVLEGVYGGATPWFELARTHLLDPLGMNDTYNGDIPAAQQANYAQGYAMAGGSPQPVPHWTWNPWPAAGALRSTPVDMLAFLRLLMGASGSASLQKAVALTERPYAKINGTVQQGLAWSIRPGPGGATIVAKDGETDGFTTWIGTLVKPGGSPEISVAILTNGSTQPVWNLGTGLLDALAR